MKRESLKLKRLELKAQGLCRDCQTPSNGRLRCRRCQQKKSKGKSLADWVTVKQHAWMKMSGEKLDRRQNGNHGRALDWALIMHREAHS